MKILAIETSCDETAVSILKCSGSFENPGVTVLGSGLYSQITKHREYGGVYPNLAKREHEKNLIPLLQKSLREAQMEVMEDVVLQSDTLSILLKKESDLLQEFLRYISTIQKPEIDIIAVTQGPGLEPALWVGLNFAKALSFAWNIPLVPVNHMEGHIFSVLSHEKLNPRIEFPVLALLASGGHTELVLSKDWLSYERIGQTRDDAVGEAFDKVARLLGLPYPGGPQISLLAQRARDKGMQTPPEHKLPRPMIGSDNYDFSYAGLKTAVLYKVRSMGDLLDEEKEMIAQEFENAAIEVLVSKTKRAIAEFTIQTLIVAGGVVANNHLRKEITTMIKDEYPHVHLLMPTQELSTDNAVMIGIAGYLRYTHNSSLYVPYTIDTELKAQGTMRLSS